MSSDHISQNLQQRNPITKEAHQRQTFFQIYLPLIIVALLIILIVVVALLAQNEQVNKWADISLIFLISVSLVVFLLVIALTIVASFYLTRLLKHRHISSLRCRELHLLLRCAVRLSETPLSNQC